MTGGVNNIMGGDSKEKVSNRRRFESLALYWAIPVNWWVEILKWEDEKGGFKSSVQKGRTYETFPENWNSQIKKGKHPENFHQLGVNEEGTNEKKG